MTITFSFILSGLNSHVASLCHSLILIYLSLSNYLSTDDVSANLLMWIMSHSPQIKLVYPSCQRRGEKSS